MAHIINKFRKALFGKRSSPIATKKNKNTEKPYNANVPRKASAADFPARFREIVSDPLNLLIERVALSGQLIDNFVVLHNGIRVEASGDLAYYGDFSQILVVNRGVHEPLEEFVFQEVLEYLPEAPTMLELGAYWGHYSMWCKLRRPSAKLILVEPEDKNLEVARHNFRRNGFEGVFINQFVGHGQFGVDKFMQEKGLEKLDILHSDIQGYELEMLADADQVLLRKGVDWLFISTHSQVLHVECIAKLKNYGYHIAISSDFENETTSFDGFILAASTSSKANSIAFGHMGRVALADAQSQSVIEYLLKLQNQKQQRRQVN